MRTREENIAIIRNASGGIFSAGSFSGERTQERQTRQNKGIRTREQSLRIIRSAATDPVLPVTLDPEATKDPGTRSTAQNHTGSFAYAQDDTKSSSVILRSEATKDPVNRTPTGDSYRQMSGINLRTAPRGGPSAALLPHQPLTPTARLSEEPLNAQQGERTAQAETAQITQSQAQAELDRLKPVLEEAKQYENEMGRYRSGAGQDESLYISALTKRDSLLKKYGYSSVDELNKAVMDYTLASGNELSFMQKMDRAGYAMDESLKNTVLSGDWWKKVLSGGAEQWAGSQLNAAGTTAGNIESIGKEGAGMVYENELKARNDWVKTLEEAKAGVIKMDAEGIKEIENIIAYYDNTLLPSLRSGVQAYETLAEDSAQAADEITAKGQQNTEKAKEGLGWGGQLAVDLLTQGTMVALDKATGAPNISMFTRGLGSGAQEARQDGASAQEQIGYGAAVGTVEVLTNKLFDGLAGIYGKGAADKVVEETIAKLAKSREGQAALRLLASGLNEGTEEILSDIINPALRTIYSDKSVKEEYSGEQLSQWLYDGLVGAIMGTGLTAVNPETYAFNAGDTQTGAAQANQAPQPPAEQKNTARSHAESTTVNTDPAQHTAAEQAVIDEYQAAVDDNLRLIVEEYKTNPNRPFARHSISPVAERQAKDAENLLGGSYSGFTNAINSNGIKHILKEHGENGVVDHSMADVNDLARIAYVLDNYDTVNQATYASGDIKYSQEFRGKNNRPAPMLVFSKKVNGTYYVIEAVPDTQYKKFWVVSAYMEKKGGITQAPNAQGQGNTPEASLASLPPKTNVSEKSIAQNRKNSNGNSQTAVEQEFRTLVGNAIREGDYQRALVLYKEYNNPALRAYKEFYTLKIFSEYAASQGYIPGPDTAVGTEEALAAFEESYQKAIENAPKDGIIKLDNVNVRRWYINRVTHIPDSIDVTLPMEKRAYLAFEARNNIRKEARDLMADEKARQKLDSESPNKTFEELIESKMKRKGMTREEAIEDIYKTATKTNESVNKELGIEVE